MSDLIFDTRLIHPLDDVPEPKLYRPDLGRMRMTRTVKFSLLALQLYLGAMAALVGWRALEISGLI